MLSMVYGKQIHSGVAIAASLRRRQEKMKSSGRSKRGVDLGGN